MSLPSKHWTQTEIDWLIEAKDVKGLTYPQIGAELGRSATECCSKYHYEMGHRSHRDGERARSAAFLAIPNTVRIRQQKLLSAPHRDLAGALFGDPPVGFLCIGSATMTAHPLTPQLGIVSAHDAAAPNSVAVVFGSSDAPKWAYVAPGAGRQQPRLLEDLTHFTPLADFNVVSSLTQDARLALNQLPILPAAKYPDGKTRYWQGPHAAIIEIADTYMGHVARAVRAEFEQRRASPQEASPSRCDGECVVRVYRERNGAGFWQTAVSGPAARSLVIKLRKKPGPRQGGIVAFSIQSRRRKPQHSGYGLPRNKQLATCVDRDVFGGFLDEAQRRGIPRGALLGRLIEVIVDDNLFDAILGKGNAS